MGFFDLLEKWWFRVTVIVVIPTTGAEIYEQAQIARPPPTKLNPRTTRAGQRISAKIRYVHFNSVTDSDQLRGSRHNNLETVICQITSYYVSVFKFDILFLV